MRIAGADYGAYIDVRPGTQTNKSQARLGGTVTKLCALLAGCLMLAAMPLPAQAPGLAGIYAQIRAEETDHSKIMWIIHEVADVHGPRVTGTPNLKAADDWAVETMTSWGLANVHLEPWTIPAAERGNTRARLGKSGALGGSRCAVPWSVDGRAAGVDAQHERSGHRAGGEARSSGIDAAERRWI